MWPDSQLELFGLHNSTRNIDMQKQKDIFRGVVSINFVNLKYIVALFLEMFEISFEKKN